jgi:predicted nucleotidyltransferase
MKENLINEPYNLPDNLFKDINYFITGSRRFGTNNKDSDLDVCVCIDSIDVIKSKISSYIESDYNRGIKFFDKFNLQINVIPLHPVDYVTWYHAANLMDLIPNKKSKSRMELHGLYQTFIGLMKSYFVNENINIDNYNSYCIK